MIAYHCEGCKKMLAKEDRRRREGNQLVMVNGTKLEAHPNMAPRFKCVCGRYNILVKVGG